MTTAPVRAGRAAAAFVLVIAAAIVSITAAQAATFTVTRTDDPVPDGCSNTDCSLREAVIAANSAPGTDTIVLQPGTYQLTLPSPTEASAGTDTTQGDLDVLEGLALSVPSGGTATIDAGARFNAGASSVTISQPGIADRVLHVRSTLTTSNVVVTGGSADQGAGILVEAGFLTMTGGGVSGNAATGSCCGGGISSVQSDVTLNGATISDNATGNCCGGGIYNESSTVTITGGNVSGNDAYSCCGGGIHNWTDPSAGRTATLSLTGVTLTGNDTRSCCGGAVYSESGSPTMLTVSNSSFRNNAASDDCCGGALYLARQATATVSDTVFSGNRTDACCGGAIYNEGTLTLTRGAITSNSVVNCCGGGISSIGSPATSLTNVTVSGNQAGAEPGQAALPSGAGIYVDSGQMDLTHVTVANNTGTNGASGIANGDVGGASQGTVALARSIVANNTGGPQCIGTITSNGYNIASDASCTLTQATDRPSTNPLLAPLANDVHELNAGSPAIDAIPANLCPPPANDQRGTTRPQDRPEQPGALCDIGAVEMAGTGATPTPTPAATATPTPTPGTTPTPTVSPTATPTPTPSTAPSTPPSISPSPTASASPSPTPTPTPGPDPIDPRCDDPGVVCGTDRSETIIGTNNAELIICGDGDDEVHGLDGNDTIECGERGDTGNKLIQAGAGDDEVDCEGKGDDEVFGGKGDDDIRCGAGNDELYGQRGNDRLVSTRGNDLMAGGAGRDRIAGGGGADTLYGGGRGDTLSGGRGNDTVYGQAGRDVLLGGPGTDTCDTERRDRARGCDDVTFFP